MLNKISTMLDAIADRLEAKGLIKEAYELDKVADSADTIDFDDIGRPSGGIGDEIKKPPMPRPSSPDIYKDKDFIKALDEIAIQLKRELDKGSDDNGDVIKIINEEDKTPLINLIKTYPDSNNESGRSFYNWSADEKRRRSLNRGYDRYTGNPDHTPDEKQKMIFVMDYLNYKLQKTYYSYHDKKTVPVVNGYAGPPFFYTMYIPPKPKDQDDLSDLDF